MRSALKVIGLLLFVGLLVGAFIWVVRPGRTAVAFGDGLEVSVPDGWQGVVRAGDDLDAVIHLENGEYRACIRVIVVEATKLTPLQIARLLLPELYLRRYPVDPRKLPSEDDGQNVMLAMLDEREDIAGRLAVERVPDNGGLAVVFLGTWSLRSDEEAARDFIDIASSLRIKK